MEQYISKEFPDGASVEAALLRAKAGGAIDTTLAKKANENLLDNWYFGNPVNQRGVTNGTAGWNEYFLDRWQGYCIYDVTKGYLEVGSGSYLVQRIENGGSIPYPVTFSVLFQDGTLGYATAQEDGGLNLSGINGNGIIDFELHRDSPYISYGNNNGSSVGLFAGKLELGDQQTLAHQDANGNWVLNEIPDYGEQLRRCQRYCFVWDYGGANTACLAVFQAFSDTQAYGLIPTPVTMRDKPVVSGGSLVSYGKQVVLMSINKCSNGIRCIANFSGVNFTVGQAVGIENGNDNDRVVFSADL